jgi:hypothetical protein
LLAILVIGFEGRASDMLRMILGGAGV